MRRKTITITLTLKVGNEEEMARTIATLLLVKSKLNLYRDKLLRRKADLTWTVEEP